MTCPFPFPWPRWSRLGICLPLLLLGVGCDRGLPPEVEITETRPALAAELAEPLKESRTAERLGVGRTAMWIWKIPDEWKLMPPTEFRDLNFAFGPDLVGECYLSMQGGGLEQNINRWQKQMGQPELTLEQIEALPTTPFFTRNAPMLDLTGSYNPAGGMDQGAAPPAKPGYRMLGVILEAPGGTTLSLKMVGPQQVVATEVENFKMVAASMSLPRSMAPDPSPGAEEPPGNSPEPPAPAPAPENPVPAPGNS